MAKKDFSELKKKLNRIEKHLAEEAAPQVNKLLQQSVNRSLVEWYDDYEPKSYERTYNFMNISKRVRTSGKGMVLTMTVDSGSMSPYPGWLGQRLQASTAYDYFFENGYHGYHPWLMHYSIPPMMYVDDDINDGFGGRLNGILNNTVKRILG